MGINEFSMDIIDSVCMEDFASFDDSFDDPIEEMSGLMDIEEDAQKNMSLAASSHIKSEDRDDEPNRIDTDIRYSKTCFDHHDDHHHHGHDNVHRPNDQHHQLPHNYSAEGAITSNHPQEDLDEQIKISMSKLVQSMHRSEMSRNMLGQQQQPTGVLFGGIGNLLPGYSSIASGIAQGRSQINTYMNHVGNL